MPTEPAAMLSLAATANGLDGPDVQPWHIKVSYQTFDHDGDPEISGTYQEFWISPRKYKRSYASANFTQTDFAMDGALYRSGNQEWPGSWEMKVRKLLIQPFGAGVDLQQSKLVKSDRSFGQTGASMHRGKTAQNQHHYYSHRLPGDFSTVLLRAESANSSL